MNYIVCSVILIYLCSGNEANFELGHHWGAARDLKENIIFFNGSVRNQKFNCISEQQRDHQLYHVYPNGNLQEPIFIGNIPKQKDVIKTEFNMKLETFDNNTEIHCDNGDKGLQFWYKVCKAVTYVIDTFSSKTSESPDSRTFKTQIGSSETVKDNKELDVLKYNEIQQVSFTCIQDFERQNLVIGVINMISNMIETHKNTFLNRMFTKSQNGTVLCCIYYDVSRTRTESWITRRVVNKTLLVYDETGPVTHRKASSEDEDFNTSLDSGDDSSGDSSRKDGDLDRQGLVTSKPDADFGEKGGNTVEPKDDTRKQDTDSNKQDADSNKQDADLGNQASRPSNQVPESSNQASGLSNHTTIIYIVSAVAVVFVLLLVSVIYIKRCRKKPEVQVDSKVLYADLEFLRRNEPESLPKTGPVEESPYAQIIGVIRPQ